MRRNGERPLLVRDAREVAPAEELHDEVELPVRRLAEVDDARPSWGGSGGSPRAPR